MSGYSLILKIQSLETQIHDLGFRWGYDKHGQWSGVAGDGFGDTVAIFPRDEELPAYARDAMLFCGTINELQTWINGIKWARDYDMLLKVSNNNKREKGEVKHREYLAKLKKNAEQAEMLEVLRATDVQNRGKKK
jgi:hypothetical protein